MLKNLFILGAILVTIVYEVWFTKTMIRQNNEMKELNKRYSELMKGDK